MKKGIHPENYRLVAFKDMSNDHVFLCRSAVSTKETIEVNGETYPVYKMEISNTSHPFYTGKIYLIDEIHTPDSSRYFYSEGYEDRFAKGEPQKQLSKEFVREWLMENGFQGKSGQKVPEMTPEIVEGISNRYIELFEHITGETFVKGETDNLLNRIEKNVTEYLQNK